MTKLTRLKKEKIDNTTYAGIYCSEVTMISSTNVKFFILELIAAYFVVKLINSYSPTMNAALAKDILSVMISVGGNFYSILLAIGLAVLTNNERMKYMTFNLIVVTL